MQLAFAPELKAFRAEAADWLNDQLAGPFKAIRGQTNQVDNVEERRAWEAALGEARWSVIGWPEEWGGRNASIAQQIIFAEEYARAKGPPRAGHLGVELLGPTLIAMGSEDQKARFLPDIAHGRAIWCQGYSEPGAGSDLANVKTRARLEGDRYIIDGQKIWTSMGTIADWCFVVARTTPGSVGNKGLSFLMVPMDQPGVDPRPIRQMTGEAEFAEVFFDGAEALAIDRIGEEGDGWKVAMALLGFERGVSTLAQQMHFKNELDDIIAAAKANGKANDPLTRQKIATAHAGLKIMRYNALRMLSGGENNPELSGAAYTYKLYWSRWHVALGELAMEVLGQQGETGSNEDRFDSLTNMYLMSRSDTIYAGTDQIQRNIISERALNMPREPRG
ncbi:Acyl-CoA dehydrogenase domain-containing protein [Sphingobium herbicidovorans NBRC 16415]|uniref:Acyl-CoA dehydrogenase domain-containing protein n=2 Tax=Sphingobium herbicidovorans TaxID=76947 RepID=A0A086P7K9_SPHHM|nr:acyl-CoA dehydrogenase family protein [Sphingobium herbicidovorans]KFG89377.1 Acyl-CoA dehydrogenase domain-containing protein [Sphingobium herbicidovorans NBRC 16415]